MKVLGIIAEYNPFHNGHLIHLSRSKELTGADVTVAVMSGDFVQRGEPAVLNKWIRSEMAVRNGVDLVLELPFAYACNNAEVFAKGSIGILNDLKCVDSICFGSEEGELMPLLRVADFLTVESHEFSLKLKQKMKEGLSFPKARQQALSYLTGEDSGVLLESPNNILGIEYLKELNRLNSDISPHTIKRVGASVDEINTEEKIAGATAIRKKINEGDMRDILPYLPEPCRNLTEINEEEISRFEMFSHIVVYSIISKSPKELAGIYSVTEGLENRIVKSAKEVSTIEDLIALIKSKRYTETRIKRILIHILLGLSRCKMNKILKEKQLYARVLSFNDKGASLIKKIKNDDSVKIPIITNISKEEDKLKDYGDLFDYDILASDIFNLVVTHDIHGASDYRRVPAYIK